MRRAIIIIIGILFVYSCNSNNSASQGIAILKGKIDNAGNNMVIVNYDTRSDTLNLNENGEFSISLDIPKPEYVTVINNNRSILLYLEPKTENSFTTDFRSNFDVIHFSGDNSDINGYLALQTKELNRSKLADQNFPHSSVETLLSEIDNFTEVFNANLKSLKSKDKDFINTEKQRLYMVEASALINIYLMNNRNNIEIPEVEQKLTEILNNIDVNNKNLSDIPNHMNFTLPYLIYEFNNKTQKDNLTFNNYSDHSKAYFNFITETFSSPEVRDELYFIVINDFIQQAGIESVSEVYDMYTKSSTNQERLAQLNNIFEAHNKIKPGNQSINFSFPDVNGKIYSLHDFKGKYVYIDVWASWCGPCRVEFPALKELKEKFKSKNIEIIGISVDENKAQWENMLKNQGLGGIQLYANGWKNDLTDFYQINGIPRFILLDKEGKIINSNAERPSGNIETVLNALEGI